MSEKEYKVTFGTYDGSSDIQIYSTKSSNDNEITINIPYKEYFDLYSNNKKKIKTNYYNILEKIIKILDNKDYKIITLNIDKGRKNLGIDFLEKLKKLINEHTDWTCQ